MSGPLEDAFARIEDYSPTARSSNHDEQGRVALVLPPDEALALQAWWRARKAEHAARARRLRADEELWLSSKAAEPVTAESSARAIRAAMAGRYMPERHEVATPEGWKQVPAWRDADLSLLLGDEATLAERVQPPYTAERSAMAIRAAMREAERQEPRLPVHKRLTLEQIQSLRDWDVPLSAEDEEACAQAVAAKEALDTRPPLPASFTTPINAAWEVPGTPRGIGVSMYHYLTRPL